MLKKCFVATVLLQSLYAQIYSDAEMSSAQGSVKGKNSNSSRGNDRFSSGDRLCFEADLICWLAKQEGNDYATSGNAITVPGTTDPNTGLIPGPIQAGKVYRPSIHVKPGFKAGLGVDLDYANWEVFSEYTYLFSKGDGEVSSNNLNAGILPLYSYTPHNSILSTTTYAVSSGATGFVSRAESYWSLHFNNINAELRKMMQIVPSVTLRPHFGFQGSWQQQLFNAQYTVSSFTSPTTLLGKNKVISEQKSWGVGLRAGLDGVWNCFEHFALYCNSALLSHFRSQGTSLDSNSAAPGYSDRVIGNTYNRLYTLNPVLQLELGIQTDWMHRGRYHFTAQVGWEEQVWFYQLARSTSIANTSLILQGVTARMRFDY